MAGKYYAVKKGRTTGIFMSWAECKKQIDGFSGAIYKSFLRLDEARRYLEGEESIKKTLCSEGMAKAYVDGSYNAENGHYSYGVVILYHGEELHFSKGFAPDELSSMRNVAGEIKASAFAMQYCMEQQIDELLIVHDYEGIARWCLGDWKANKEGTKEYVEFYKKAKEKVRIHFEKVKGHSGDLYNDRADRLAKEALGL